MSEYANFQVVKLSQCDSGPTLLRRGYRPSAHTSASEHYLLSLRINSMDSGCKSVCSQVASWSCVFQLVLSLKHSSSEHSFLVSEKSSTAAPGSVVYTGLKRIAEICAAQSRRGGRRLPISEYHDLTLSSRFSRYVVSRAARRAAPSELVRPWPTTRLAVYAQICTRVARPSRFGDTTAGSGSAFLQISQLGGSPRLAGPKRCEYRGKSGCDEELELRARPGRISALAAIGAASLGAPRCNAAPVPAAGAGYVKMVGAMARLGFRFCSILGRIVRVPMLRLKDDSPNRPKLGLQQPFYAVPGQYAVCCVRCVVCNIYCAVCSVLDYSVL